MGFCPVFIGLNGVRPIGSNLIIDLNARAQNLKRNATMSLFWRFHLITLSGRLNSVERIKFLKKIWKFQNGTNNF